MIAARRASDRFARCSVREEVPMSNKSIALPYGHETRTIEVPEENLAWVVGPKKVQGVVDIKEAVLSAIRNPIGSPTLAELVAEYGKKTLILVDDRSEERRVGKE